MRFIVVTFSVLLIAVIAAMAVGYWVERPVVLGEPAFVVVSPGDGTNQIAAKLSDSRLIHSERAFKVLARLRNIDRHLRPGRYRFEGTVRLSDILAQLHDGRAVIVMLTIPEGWTLARIASHSANELGFPVDSFLAIARDPTTIAQATAGASTLEGYLHPETYNFFWGVPAKEVLDEMLEKSASYFDDSLSNRAAALGWNRHRALTMASLIEAEAAEGKERGRISGVFHNRLRQGWLLQCDPTVVYAMGGLPSGRPLQTSDLDLDSPYNTYRYPGLPPGPICSPGGASILAALYPDSTDAMYFVADGNGSHIFSRTLDEHNRARVRVKRPSK